MQELSQLIGLIVTLVTIILKTTISSTNALSYSSLSGNYILSISSIWRGIANPVSIFTAHDAVISSVFTHVPVVSLPRCVPADYNSTLPNFSGHKYNDWTTAHNHICSRGDSRSTTHEGTDISTARKLDLKKIARLASKFCKTIVIVPEIVSNVWTSHAARRVRKALRRWAVAFIAFLECAAEPDTLDLLRIVQRALVRLARKGAYTVSSRRRKTTRKKSLLNRRYRYYKPPYIITTDLNGAYSLREMPLVVHSFNGHGVTQMRWHTTSVLYSADDMQPTYIEQTEYFFEIRLPHCVRRSQSDAPSSKLGAKWTHRIRMQIAERMEGDKWLCVSATRDEVYYAGDEYTETRYMGTEYHREVPQEI
ncbi:hypothetical protein D9619_004877 [Psilocybe cf. subviscida]|uniref:Uncharacterized protein n=1 Tax=Psilocybe cf. subviscida TaxID=2480587 RepID=A0A8H5F7W2_9AGAR|nr:hypothetical protein D9619_004877 [Psilocybe cf. subviscida]